MVCSRLPRPYSMPDSNAMSDRKMMKYALLLLGSVSCLVAADAPVFSGPQPGEVTTPFGSVDIVGPDAGTERDIIKLNGGAPTALVFVHGLERSMLPLMRAVDSYGASHADKLRTEFVFLADDRVGGMERFGRALNSIKLKGRPTLSVDGLEGPGNYGLNKQCLLTILAAKDNRVHANFALVQPGIADGGRVLAAIAKLIGDKSPPTTDQLKAEFEQRYRMARDRKAPAGAPQKSMAKQDPFPGAVPTDDRLVGLLRQFIRKTNDASQVDAVLKEVRALIAGNDDLRRQAIDGWTRILHFGDRYGTDYAREQGRAFLAGLKQKE
jgi:hypothetical protein